MDSFILALVSIAFLALATIGLLSPRRIATYFGSSPDSADYRNELRAVYGGLPFAISLLGILALTGMSPFTIKGSLLTVALLLLGMAAGRLISLCIERPTRRSYLFLLLELLLGGLALYGFINQI